MVFFSIANLKKVKIEIKKIGEKSFVMFILANNENKIEKIHSFLISDDKIEELGESSNILKDFYFLNPKNMIEEKEIKK